MLTCTSTHSFLSKSHLFPSSQTYAFPIPGSASAFWSQPFLCSCCSSCSFIEVAKWMCLKFRLFQKSRHFLFFNKWQLHQEKNPRFQESFSWDGACLDWPLLPAELQPANFTQIVLLAASLPAGWSISSACWDIRLSSSPAVGLAIQQRGSCWPK